jgi:hypothetical protein
MWLCVAVCGGCGVAVCGCVRLCVVDVCGGCVRLYVVVCGCVLWLWGGGV